MRFRRRGGFRRGRGRFRRGRGRFRRGGRSRGAGIRIGYRM